MTVMVEPDAVGMTVGRDCRGRAAQLFHDMFLRAKQSDHKFSLGILERETGIQKTSLHKMMTRAAAQTFDPRVVAKLFEPLCSRGIRATEVAALMGERLSSFNVAAIPEALAPLPVVTYGTAREFSRILERGTLGLGTDYSDRESALAALERCGGIVDWQNVPEMGVTCLEVAMWDRSFCHALPGQRLVVDYARKFLIDGKFYVLRFGSALQCGMYRDGWLVPCPHEGHDRGDFEIPLGSGAAFTILGQIRRVVGPDL